MTGLDTNVLVRYFAQDDPIQSRKAAEIIEHRFTEEDPGFISLVTIVETVWALGGVYTLSDQEIVKVVEQMLQADTLVIQNEQEVFTATMALKAGRGSFADSLISALGKWVGCTSTLTFDKKAGQLGGFELL
jgi:predicted nucleic-acid-binding protein